MAVIYPFINMKISKIFQMGTFIGIILLAVSPFVPLLTEKTGIEFGNVTMLSLIGIPLCGLMWFLTLKLEGTDKGRNMNNEK